MDTGSNHPPSSGDENEVTLDRLLRDARDADRKTRIDWRDPIAAYGVAAVGPMRSWLEDPVLGAFAGVVLEKIGHRTGAGLKPAAVKALAAGRATADPGIVHLIDAALGRLGWKQPSIRVELSPEVELPKGAHIAPPFDEAHHVVIAHVAATPTEWGDVYLFECGRWFSGGWVRTHGGLLDPADRLICEQCRAAIYRGRGNVGGSFPKSSAEPRPSYVLGGIWHIINGDLVEAAGLGPVYLTMCYRWYEAAGRDLGRGSLPAHEQLCRSCEKSLESPDPSLIGAPLGESAEKP